MNRIDAIPTLRGIERALAPELERAGSQDLAPPPRQPVETYAPPSYRQSNDGIDPIIKALLTHLPPPGEVWPSEARILWVNLLTGSFQMIYREAEIPAPVPSGFSQVLPADTETTQAS